ncbi:MAG: hydroxymethylpyrimidine/phosphomethylpyrimidine kinase [Undibacterium sp.]|uniref:bifunctional hydroxymethylpyrimidine kinase/phosphomethylpyrimidine kinase n=1 Tax=Undibacterium sp. TaxID=1914977 RepID=UPI0027181DFB|nr:hydroxymethylpyrimidine/phosphomethylpyrimidine kinase [Undibacterium sp.]MDO8651472.1 hydroxymethylpyrimidine/phosphomethylpyrimidine kinase [Undibacterium sp.]
MTVTRPCVLVFAGHDPSGGAGIQADIEAIAAQGAHALPVITALTVQDNDHVYAVHAVDAQIILQQAMTLIAKIPVAAIKIGIVAHGKNAAAIANFIQKIQRQQPGLPVVLDTVLGSGQGDALGLDDAVAALQPLLKVATLMTPNLPEAKRLCPEAPDTRAQAHTLLRHQCRDVLIKGGHGSDEQVCNQWFGANGQRDWNWPRLPGEFHGSGCTLAAAIAGQLALGQDMPTSLQLAQEFSQRSLQQAYRIAAGQLIPQRHFLAAP